MTRSFTCEPGRSAQTASLPPSINSVTFAIDFGIYMDAADRLLLRIDDRLQILRDFPEAGTARDDIRPGFRLLVEGPYLLLYEYDKAKDEVELVSVVDGRRDLSEIF